jgi:hypothetical protein
LILRDKIVYSSLISEIAHFYETEFDYYGGKPGTETPEAGVKNLAKILPLAGYTRHPG